MSEPITISIPNVYARHAVIRDSRYTYVQYTEASGLSDWSGLITDNIVGTSSSPYYTTQIANVNSAKTIRIGFNVTTIGIRAFYGCSSLTSVTIPSSMVGIGNNAFGACIGLTSMTIPEGVTYIGNGAF